MGISSNPATPMSPPGRQPVPEGIGVGLGDIGVDSDSESVT